jgi:hypothetical protein
VSVVGGCDSLAVRGFSGGEQKSRKVRGWKLKLEQQ